MKSFILVALLAPQAVQAEEAYSYSCKSQNQAWTATVALTNKELIIPGYQDRVAVYTNKGLQSGNGSMSNKYAYVLNLRKSKGMSPSDKGKTYFVSPELLSGGKRLRDGSIGGFVFARWEDNDYLKCVLK